MKHISVRVPWHDNGWNSHVCANPRCNTFCKQLPNIVNSKVDCEQEKQRVLSATTIL